ncbi:sorting and assembly machinery component 50 [Quaeritorhiza haematococci]|nr:sorting and assembly machinery component 50 [Quaeritorhiza haematococci]
MHGNDAVGGDVYWAAGLSLLTPLPFLSREHPIRGHFFVNGGNLMAVNFASSTPAAQKFQDTARALFATPSVSVGAGLAVRFANILRLELNYCIPVSVVNTDRVKPGFQFGVGLTFM